MYLLQECSEEFERINLRARGVLSQILTNVKPTAADIRIPSHQDIYATPARQGKLYLLKDGLLSNSIEGRLLFYYEPGDLVGFEQNFAAATATVKSDFAVIVDEYDGQSLLSTIASSPELVRLWTEYLSLQFSLTSDLIEALSTTETVVAPELRTYRPGDIIIEHGTSAHEVFTLVEGNAEAWVKNTRVGDILVGEIFGVVAALTGIPRTATVKANSTCLVMILPRDNFLQLIETRPNTVLKMVEDMARTLASLNEKVVSLSMSKF